MKIYSNNKLIKRNHLVGNVTSFLSIAVLGAGMYFSFTDKDGSKLPFTFTALILGFLLFQFGNYFTGRWGRSPRPDELISQSLKGLDDRYSLYHYTTPIPHLLTGPAGIFCLIPFTQAGNIKYDQVKGRWKQTGGNAFMKIFGGENLGKPENEARYTADDAQKLIRKMGFNLDNIPVESILVFLNPKTSLHVEESPVIATTGEKLKDTIRKRIKDKPILESILKEIQEKLLPK
jgi:hypothetical protein